MCPTFLRSVHLPFGTIEFLPPPLCGPRKKIPNEHVTTRQADPSNARVTQSHEYFWVWLTDGRFGSQMFQSWRKGFR